VNILSFRCKDRMQDAKDESLNDEKCRKLILLDPCCGSGTNLAVARRLYCILNAQKILLPPS
jgi:hypothetical protein